MNFQRTSNEALNAEQGLLDGPLMTLRDARTEATAKTSGQPVAWPVMPTALKLMGPQLSI